MDASARMLQDAANVADPLLGVTLADRYRVLRKLGEGGMGVVYEAEHVLIRKRVAIKCLVARFATNADVLTRFHREALAATAIGNEHIIEVTDMGRMPDGGIFLVLEFLDGHDFAHLLEAEGALTVGRSVRIVSQICEAIGAAHAKNIVHRDLKPENVYLIRRGDNTDFVKVLDFGISKFLDDEKSASSTRTGAALGTPYYMAPEQAQGQKDIDHRADIYAIGVILFHALTGRYPFEEESLPMLIVRLCNDPAPDVRTFRPEVPAPIAALIAKMLAKSPADRPSHCEEIRAALRSFADIESLPVIVADPVSPLSPSLASTSDVRPKPTRVAPADPAIVDAPTMYATPNKTAAIPLKSHVGDAVEAKIAAPRASSTVPLAISGGLAAVALVVFGIVRATKQPETAISPVIAAPQTTIAVDAGAPSRPAAPLRASVNVTTSPPNAQLFLNGTRVENPYVATADRTALVQRFEARLRGHRTVIEEVTFARSFELTITLARGTGIERRPLEAAPSIEPETTRTPIIDPIPTQPATTTTVTPPVQTQPTTPTPQTPTTTPTTVTTPAQTIVPALPPVQEF